MPVYELLCLAKPAMPRAELVRMMQRVSEVVMQRGGVLTRVLSYGEQHLAVDIRRPFERYSKAHIWQMNFMVAPEALKDVNHELRVNTNVLRWVNIKRQFRMRGPEFLEHLQETEALRMADRLAAEHASDTGSEISPTAALGMQQQQAQPAAPSDKQTSSELPASSINAQ
mmetsp:Transcript_13102/g.23078  ORF Transcript_13102/g.23078 Transcript_13102/m.23078 type:complete len:170 (-) Transcript_13102:988-1497(-)